MTLKNCFDAHLASTHTWLHHAGAESTVSFPRSKFNEPHTRGCTLWAVAVPSGLRSYDPLGDMGFISCESMVAPRHKITTGGVVTHNTLICTVRASIKSRRPCQGMLNVHDTADILRKILRDLTCTSQCQVRPPHLVQRDIGQQVEFT